MRKMNYVHFLNIISLRFSRTRESFVVSYIFSVHSTFHGSESWSHLQVKPWPGVGTLYFLQKRIFAENMRTLALRLGSVNHSSVQVAHLSSLSGLLCCHHIAAGPFEILDNEAHFNVTHLPATLGPSKGFGLWAGGRDGMAASCKPQWLTKAQHRQLLWGVN